MRHSCVLIVGLLSSLLLSPDARASKTLLLGEPGFALSMTVAGHPRLGEKFRVRIEAGSQQHGNRAIGEVHIRVPDGIEVVAGDTVRQVHPSNRWRGPLDSEWNLFLRPSRTGQFTIDGWMRISRGSHHRWDETEEVLDLDVRADTVICGWARAIRFERVTDGQRFRYGGEHMVLIDGPEEWLANAPGPRQDPEALERLPGVCKGCGLAGPKIIRYVVTVGTDGTVRWIEPRTDLAPPEDQRVLSAAEDALRRWRFRPARLGGRAIPNWAVVDVPVLPESK